MDLWDDQNLTFSKVVLNWLLAKDKRILTAGFGKNLIEAIGNSEDQKELKALLSSNRIIPDAYFIEKERKMVFLFEVEDTNPISAEKLRKLSEIWFRLDSLDWEIRVFLIDRYMHYWSVLPLSKVWRTLEFEDKSKRLVAKSDNNETSGPDWEEVYQNLKGSHVLGDDGWL